MDKSGAIAILNSRSLVEQTGVEIPVKVTNVTPFTREDDTRVNILNFNAMTPYHQSQAKKLLGEGKYQEATNQNVSSSARVGIDFTPSKGQQVYITLEERKNKAGDATILVVSNVRAFDKAKGSTLSFDDVETPAEVAEAADVAIA